MVWGYKEYLHTQPNRPTPPKFSLYAALEYCVAAWLVCKLDALTRLLFVGNTRVFKGEFEE